MKVYISGKISGLGKAEAINRFYAAEVRLMSAGYTDVVNPMKLTEKESWHECMKVCIDALKECEGIYFVDLPEKTDSYGVKIDALWAEKLGMERIVI